MASEQTQHAILVSNLDANVTDTQLGDFFSFCGKITSLSLRRKGDSAEGILYFEKEASAKTALLLNNALIKEKAMTVEPYSEEQLQQHNEEDAVALKQEERGVEPEISVKDVQEENITQREGERTATASIASLLASGYILAVDAIERAKKLDEEKHISSSVKQGTDAMKERASHLDTEYKISEKASSTTRSLNEQWNQFDESYGISRGTQTAGTAIGETVSEWGNTVATGFQNTLQTPSVQNTLETVSQWTNNVGRSIGAFLQPAAEAVNREYTDIKETTNREINAKQMERARAAEGVHMDELGDIEMREPQPNRQPQPNAESEVIRPSPSVEKIPPPEPSPDE